MTLPALHARLACLALLLIGCSCTHRVSAEQAKKLVDEGAKLVDVRTPEEFASEHLPGAINLPLSELEQRLAELGPKDQAVVVYCHTGFRSARAASTLADHGFTKIGDLGAMDNWPK